MTWIVHPDSRLVAAEDVSLEDDAAISGEGEFGVRLDVSRHNNLASSGLHSFKRSNMWPLRAGRR